MSNKFNLRKQNLDVLKPGTQDPAPSNPVDQDILEDQPKDSPPIQIKQNIEPETSPVQSTTPNPKPILVKVIGGKLNVRQHSTKQSKILFEVHKNDILEVLDDEGSWLYVEVKDKPLGYVMKAHTEPV